MQVRLPRTAALVTVAVLGTSLTTASFASTAGRATQNQTVTSGSWAATASPSSVTFPTSALVPPAPVYVSVTNSGSETLTGSTYSMSRSGLVVGTINVDACVGGTWNESTNVCSGGTITSVVTSLTTPRSVSAAGTYPAAPGASIRLRVSESAALASSSTVTLSVSVSRSGQVRAATTTTS
jgi:hypothetical protein